MHTLNHTTLETWVTSPAAADALGAEVSRRGIDNLLRIAKCVGPLLDTRSLRDALIIMPMIVNIQNVMICNSENTR